MYLYDLPHDLQGEANSKQFLLWTPTSCLSNIVIKNAWLAEIVNGTVGIYGVLRKSKQSQRRICVSRGLFLATDKIREIVQRLAKAVGYRELSVCVWLYFLRCTWRVELCAGIGDGSGAFVGLSFYSVLTWNALFVAIYRLIFYSVRLQ